MWIEFRRFIVPFLIAVFQVLTAALALGILPALWVLFRERRWGRFLKWSLLAALCLTALFYGLPLANEAWKNYTSKGSYRYSAMWIGFAITGLFAPMIIPEPLRIARRRARKDRPEEKLRRRRRKRRSQQLPGEIKIR